MSLLLRMMEWSCEAEREEFFSLPPTVMSPEELMMGVKLAKQLEALSILSVCNRGSSSGKHLLRALVRRSSSASLTSEAVRNLG